MTATQTSVSSRMAVGFPGLISDASRNTNLISGTSEEASAEIPYGVFVGEGADRNGMLLLAAITDRVKGLLVYSSAAAKPNELGDSGLKSGITGSVMTAGRAFVYVEEAVTRASKVLIRCIAAGAEKAGATRDTADASDLLDASAWCRFVEDSTGAGFVEVEFNVVGIGADPLD